MEKLHKSFVILAIVAFFTLTTFACNSSGGGGEETPPVEKTYYQDADGDGYGNLATPTESTTQPTGYVTNSTDCDDTDEDVNPGAEEVCGDNIDSNCDGEKNNGCQLSIYYSDGDGDGHGDENEWVEAYTQPPGYVVIPGDCDDTDPTINPDAEEVCNEVDDDCDGSTNEGFDGACERKSYFLDWDGDLYGDPNVSEESFVQLVGYVLNDNDCDDTNALINPDAQEFCDDIDHNCNGEAREGFNDTCERKIYYLDWDGDGHGDITESIEDYNQPPGYVTSSGDCDDSNPEVNPDTEEVCNYVDDNCDGSIDEGFNATCTEFTYYLDWDGDLYGDPNNPIQAYFQPSGYVPNDFDCNDFDATIKPSAEEVCDFTDNNCNGVIDEGFEDNPTCQGGSEG